MVVAMAQNMPQRLTVSLQERYFYSDTLYEGKLLLSLFMFQVE